MRFIKIFKEIHSKTYFYAGFISEEILKLIIMVKTSFCKGHQNSEFDFFDFFFDFL